MWLTRLLGLTKRDMDAGLATLLAAVITGGLALLGHLINRFRKENRDDHAYVQGLLTMLHKSTSRIERKVERVDERLDNHIEFHATGGMLDKRGAVHQDGAEGNSQVSS